jgi:cytochrome b6-f complex iron-sulfur subunit
MTGGRRSLIRWLLGGGIFSSIASFLYPVTKFMMPPNVPEAAVNEVVAGKVQMLKPNAAAIVKFGNKPVLLVRVSETEWKALTAVCTHLNCTVQYQENTRQIWCACHNGYYDLNGKVLSGPPPKPLDEFVVRIRGDEVVITRGA